MAKYEQFIHTIALVIGFQQVLQFCLCQSLWRSCIWATGVEICHNRLNLDHRGNRRQKCAHKIHTSLNMDPHVWGLQDVDWQENDNCFYRKYVDNQEWRSWSGRNTQGPIPSSSSCQILCCCKALYKLLPCLLHILRNSPTSSRSSMEYCNWGLEPSENVRWTSRKF